MIELPDIEQLLNECRFEAARSSGKGGQNVNKVSTKVILLFDVRNSVILSDEQKELIESELHTRTSKEGIFRLTSGRERTQLANRKLVEAKFISLISDALRPESERIATKPTLGSKLRKASNKKAQSGKKASRAANWLDDEDL